MSTASRLLLLACLAASACRTGPLDEFGDLATTPITPSDDSYDAHVLITNLGRFGIFKRSASRNLCSWLIVAQSMNMPPGWTTPKGWQFESASINTSEKDCFTLVPLGAGFWPAEGKGTISFDATVPFPCTVSVHAEIAADKTANGAQKPADISADEHFDIDGLTVDGACK